MSEARFSLTHVFITLMRDRIHLQLIHTAQQDTIP